MGDLTSTNRSETSRGESIIQEEENEASSFYVNFGCVDAAVVCMSGSARVASGEMVFHVMNRGVDRRDIIEKGQDSFARLVHSQRPIASWRPTCLGVSDRDRPCRAGRLAVLLTILFRA